MHTNNKNGNGAMAALSQKKLDQVRRALGTAHVGDVLDTMGYHHQYLPPEVCSMTPGVNMVGYAMPVLEIDCPQADRTFGLLFEALDSVGRDEVYVASGGSLTYALWGELMTGRAKSQGGVGAVLNGYTRDTAQIREMDFPVFAVGSYGQDQRGRGKVAAYRVPIRIGETAVSPGDLLMGDGDGVLCVPQAVMAEAVENALEKKAIEDRIAVEIAEGLSATEAFEKYGVM